MKVYFINIMRRYVISPISSCEMMRRQGILCKRCFFVFGNQSALKSFLYNCVQNAALNYLEKLQVRAKANRRLGVKAPDEEDVFCFQVETDVFEEIFAAIDELPTECQRIFKMSYIEMLDIKTICEQLDVAESTVKTQRQRAKKYLRERLQHLYPVVVFMFF